MSDERNPKKIYVPSSSSNTSQEIPASPPRFVSLEELMAAAKGMTQMSLAHEIAVNKDFKLEPEEEPPINSIEKAVKETMHKVFWDILDNELKEIPPKFTQVLLLLEEVKSSLLDLLLPQHSRLKQNIDQVLDMDLIKQQAEKGTLHEAYMGYAQFVITIMGKLCAPVRDGEIARLVGTTEIIPLFQGILNTLKLMKVDMANFTIGVMRPQIIANSITYERQKFNDFLKVHPDGLERTKEWLKKHTASAGDPSTPLAKRIDAVLNEAYLDLSQWQPDNLLPETLTMDATRITAVTNELTRLNYAGTALLLVFSQAGANLASIAEWKQTIKKTILTLITAETKPDFEAISLKMVTDVNSAAIQYNSTGHVTSGLEDAIKTIDCNHKIYNLLQSRIREFLSSAITSRTADRLRIPPGLSILQEELTQLAGGFLRIVAHNREVFGEHYINLLTELLTAE